MTVDRECTVVDTLPSDVDMGLGRPGNEGDSIDLTSDSTESRPPK